jgi:hypothetical protein
VLPHKGYLSDHTEEPSSLRDHGMIELELHEAQLYRMLSSLFGTDRIVVRMSALAACGGEVREVPESLKPGFTSAESLKGWAAQESCLFTVVDHNDSPKMVLEFFSGFGKIIEAHAVDHHRILPALLQEVGVHYVTIPRDQFSRMIDPSQSFDLTSYLGDFFDTASDEDADLR